MLQVVNRNLSGWICHDDLKGSGYVFDDVQAFTARMKADNGR